MRTVRYVKITVKSNWTVGTKTCSIKTKQEEHKKELLQSRGAVKAWKEMAVISEKQKVTNGDHEKV